MNYRIVKRGNLYFVRFRKSFLWFKWWTETFLDFPTLDAAESYAQRQINRKLCEKHNGVIVKEG